MRAARRLLVPLLLFSAQVWAATPDFDRWADDLASTWVRASPQYATDRQYFSGKEQDVLDRQLSLSTSWGEPYSEKGAKARAVLARRGLQELERFPAAGLTPTQRVSAAAIRRALEDAVADLPYARQRFVFEQMWGLHLELVKVLTTKHPIRNRRDVENYLARLALVGPLLDEGCAEAKAAAAAGFLPPRFILEAVIRQLDEFLAKAPPENVFVVTLDARIQTLGQVISPEDRAKFVGSASQEVGRTVIPAYRRARVLLAEQLPRSSDDAGLWRLPQGEQGYARALNRNTNTNLTPDAVHALGLREMARIEGEMDKLLKQLGATEGSVESRYLRLAESLRRPEAPDPRPGLLAQVTGIVDEAQRRSKEMFDQLPAAPVAVKREPSLTEATTGAHYTLPAPDGSRPGIYWLPLRGLDPTLMGLGPTMRSTAYHEAIPGHHFQLTIQQESTELPRFRKLTAFGYAEAYVEGWGLYAERLADESGWYDGDVTGRLGFLQMQLIRARRLVVDTGLHAKKWSREQVIAFGCSPRETDRYVVRPGQATAYMIGQLRIVELREKARKALGAKFSLKQFHAVVLRGGAVPLDVLEQEVDAWIASVRSGPE